MKFDRTTALLGWRLNTKKLTFGLDVEYKKFVSYTTHSMKKKFTHPEEAPYSPGILIIREQKLHSLREIYWLSARYRMIETDLIECSHARAAQMSEYRRREARTYVHAARGGNDYRQSCRTRCRQCRRREPFLKQTCTVVCRIKNCQSRARGSIKVEQYHDIYFYNQVHFCKCRGGPLLVGSIYILKSP